MTRPDAAPIAGVPVKSFDDAKRRLSAGVDDFSRRALVSVVASHVLRELAEAGIEPLVVAGSAEVAEWAADLMVDSIADPGGSLNQAAAAAVDRARDLDRPWLVIPADLPLLRSTDLAPALSALAAGHPVIAPARDGGTNLIGRTDQGIDFSYGPASFHRHLASLARAHPKVLVGPGLQLDLDSPLDLAACLRHPRGQWLAGHPAIPSLS